MRELRPLQLPQLIASRNTATQLADEPSSTQQPNPTSVPERAWPSWSASDSSAPSTPTYSAHSHSRYPSSNSSVGSTSSPQLELPEATSVPGKGAMPKLQEHPLERDDQGAAIDHDAYATSALPSFADDAFEEVLSTRTTVILRNSDAFDFGDGLFSDEHRPTRRPPPKRQASGDSPVSIISTKLGERFPSLSRRRNHKKKDSKFADAGLRISTSSRPPSTRSSSLTGSMVQSVEHLDSPVALSRKPSAAGLHQSAPVSPVDIKRTEVEEPIDRQKLASTPLLPPMVNALDQPQEEAVQSPLQSPTVADVSGSFSMVSSPSETPQLCGMSSPPLSSRPSIASFHPARVGTLPSSDTPPLIIADPGDEWSIKLGHANFTILPEPYLPEAFTADAYHRLVLDWESARFNYFKHLHRTLEHYGANSKIYRLTEQKWAEVDALWKLNKDLVAVKAAKQSDEALPVSPEPAMSLPMPPVHDIKNDGKFPILGDEGIVGPMKQDAPRIQPPEPARRSGFQRFFDSLKSSSFAFGTVKARKVTVNGHLTKH